MSKLKVSIRSIVMFLFALMFVVAGLSLLSRYTSEQFINRGDLYDAEQSLFQCNR